MSHRLFVYLLFFSVTAILPVTGFATGLPTVDPAQALIDEMSQPGTLKSGEIEPVRVLVSWAEAWSAKDFNRYSHSYTDDYRGVAGSHQKWRQQRRSRIVRSGSIRVTLSGIKIRSRSATKIIIDALQEYQSSTYQDRVLKRFNLTKINGNWKISQEQTLSRH